MRIWLDLDGVLADFVGASARLLGFDPAAVKRWDYYDDVGSNKADFWHAINSAGHDFWKNVEPYPWCGFVHKFCRLTAPTTILTTPSDHCSSLSGKLAWMHSHLGQGFRDYLMGWNKYEVAAPDCVLIDDGDHNCAAFIEAGGKAILFPRPWNENRHLADDPIKFLYDELIRLKGELHAKV